MQEAGGRSTDAVAADRDALIVEFLRGRKSLATS